MQIKQNVYSSFFLGTAIILQIWAEFSDHIGNDSSSKVNGYYFYAVKISKLVTLSIV
jgi:hypothetical protein